MSMFRNENDGIARLIPGTVGTKTITMPVETFYEVVNALRDQCGCDRCKHNADFFIVHGLSGGGLPHPDFTRYDSLFKAQA